MWRRLIAVPQLSFVSLSERHILHMACTVRVSKRDGMKSPFVQCQEINNA